MLKNTLSRASPKMLFVGFASFTLFYSTDRLLLSKLFSKKHEYINQAIKK